MTTPSQHNLLGGPAPTLLPAEPDATARDSLATASAREVAARLPSVSLPWALLAEEALAADAVAAYAYSRTGYHRGLDALRRAGWRGSGPVPLEHVPNQGFLRALLALAEAAGAIGEETEEQRCRTFLTDCGTSAPAVAAVRHVPLR